jgi:Disulphide bond corrector protein DsbC
MRRDFLGVALLAAPGLFSQAVADGPVDIPPETVRWTVAAVSKDVLRPGSSATLQLSGTILDGWHVYALTQQPGGPTPLRVTLDSNDIASVAGGPTDTAAEKVHDARFGLDTQYYTHAFSVQLPVRLSQQLIAGRQVIPVSVRFQSCSDRVCLPPKTLHLSVPVDVPTIG